MKRPLKPLLLIAFLATSALAQEQMGFDEYDPKSTLVVPEHPRTRAKFPFIDVHNHQRGGMSKVDVQKLAADMDRINRRRRSSSTRTSAGSATTLPASGSCSTSCRTSTPKSAPCSTSSDASPRNRRQRVPGVAWLVVGSQWPVSARLVHH